MGVEARLVHMFRFATPELLTNKTIACFMIISFSLQRAKEYSRQRCIITYFVSTDLRGCIGIHTILILISK